MKETIIQVFNDKRKLEYVESADYGDMFESGDLFISENNEPVFIELQMVDFDEKELADKVEIAEKLYEIHKTHSSVYIICPTSIDVTVKECEIKSEADFTIRLAAIDENPAEIVLDIIKDKLKNGKALTEEDLDILAIIPIMGLKKDRKRLREECFRIMNNI